jgi:hypothetical protein
MSRSLASWRDCRLTFLGVPRRCRHLVGEWAARHRGPDADGAAALTMRGCRRSLALILAGWLLLPAVALAVPASVGSLDSSYGNDAPDALVTSFGGQTFDPGGLAALPDGASLVADKDAVGLAQLTGDQSQGAGAPDPGFGLDGIVAGPVPDESDAVAVTPGGSYLVAGSSNGKLMVAQFKPNGSLDTSFASGSPTWQIHSESLTSVLRPGTLRR